MSWARFALEAAILRGADVEELRALRAAYVEELRRELPRHEQMLPPPGPDDEERE